MPQIVSKSLNGFKRDPKQPRKLPENDADLTASQRAGLITRRRQGREVLYEVEAERLNHATRGMAQLARQWDRRLDTIKRLAEAEYAQTNEKT